MPGFFSIFANKTTKEDVIVAAVKNDKKNNADEWGGNGQEVPAYLLTQKNPKASPGVWSTENPESYKRACDFAKSIYNTDIWDCHKGKYSYADGVISLYAMRSGGFDYFVRIWFGGIEVFNGCLGCGEFAYGSVYVYIMRDGPWRKHFHEVFVVPVLRKQDEARLKELADMKQATADLPFLKCKKCDNFSDRQDALFCCYCGDNLRT